MNKLSLLSFLLLTVLFSHAQVPKGMGSSDPEAKKVLDAVSAKFR